MFFYVNDEPESKFLYIETIKLYCIVLYCIVMRFVFPLFSYISNFSLIIAKPCNLFKTTWVAIANPSLSENKVSPFGVPLFVQEWECLSS